VTFEQLVAVGKITKNGGRFKLDSGEELTEFGKHGQRLDC